MDNHWYNHHIVLGVWHRVLFEMERNRKEVSNMKAIVTVKLPRLDPRNKEFGVCPLSKLLKTYICCSDITGEHHSYIETGTCISDIEKKAKAKFAHVTRIEIADEWEQPKHIEVEHL